MNYFFLCDSPTLESGFAKVSKNILPRLDLPNKHVWALGYNGEPHPFPMNLYPANVNSAWESNYNIRSFFDWLFSFNGPQTLWTLHDPFRLRKFRDGFIKFKQNGGRLISYIPVDSPLKPEDAEFLNLVDVPVAYSEYGRREIKKFLPEDKRVLVLPHGCDPDFQKVDKDFKNLIFPDVQDRILVGVVNSNTERKALHRSLQVVDELNKINDNYSLYLHSNPRGYYDLKGLAHQLGILDRTIFADVFFDNTRIGSNRCPKETLIGLYNSFDLFLSTSYGEGWGLTVSEAACCEIPIAIPKNSVMPEIYRQESAIWLNTPNTALYNNSFVPDINPKQAAQTINDWVENTPQGTEITAAKEDVEKFKWEDIAQIWQGIIK